MINQWISVDFGLLHFQTKQYFWSNWFGEGHLLGDVKAELGEYLIRRYCKSVKVGRWSNNSDYGKYVYILDFM